MHWGVGGSPLTEVRAEVSPAASLSHTRREYERKERKRFPAPGKVLLRGQPRAVSGPQGVPGSPPLTWRSQRRLPAAARMGRAGTTLAVNFGCVNFPGGAKGPLRRQLGSSREDAA